MILLTLVCYRKTIRPVVRAAAKLVLLAMTWLAAPAASRAADLDELVRAYPDKLERLDGDLLVWRDGTRMRTDDGMVGKSEEQMLHAGDVKDMFRYPYQRGPPADVPGADPGRIRNAAFFGKMYGECRAGQVVRDLVPIDWLPRHGGGSVSITRINGVADKLRAVSDELDQLPDEDIRYLKPTAGTFNCRTIAGTSDLSAHSYGIAIDINVAYSDYWRWSKTGYRNRIPYAIVEVFERHGFIWGGKWKHFDTMHFEYRPELTH